VQAVTVSHRRAAADVAIQVAGRLFNLGLGVAVTLIIVRLLGDAKFGQWSTILAVVQIAAYVADFGLEQVVVRQAATDPDDEAKWLGALVVLRVALGVPVFLAALVLLAIIATNDAMLVASMIVIAMSIVTAPMFLRPIFQLRTRNDVPVFAMTVQSVLWTAGAAALLAAGTGAGLEAVAALFAATTTIGALVVMIAGLRVLRPQLRHVRPQIREILRVGVPIGIAGLLVTAYAKIDQILVFVIVGDRAAGLYGAAYRFLDQAQFLPTSVMTTLYPMMARAYASDRDQLRRLMQVAIEVLLIGSLPVLAFMIAAGPQVMGFIFGESFAPAGHALAILMGSFVIISVGYVAGYLIVVVDEQRTFMRYAVIGLIINLALNLTLLPHFHYIAAAWATLITDIVVTGLTVVLVRRRLEFVPDTSRIVRALVASVVLGVGVALFRHAIAVWLLAIVAAAGYAVLCLAFGAVRPRQTFDLLRGARA
jgi:O-antigen/teichoic acid export membrane protein